MSKKTLVLMCDETDDLWFSFKEHPNKPDWLDTLRFKLHPFILEKTGCLYKTGTIKILPDGVTEVL